jgi:hypothetical protein
VPKEKKGIKKEENGDNKEDPRFVIFATHCWVDQTKEGECRKACITHGRNRVIYEDLERYF